MILTVVAALVLALGLFLPSARPRSLHQDDSAAMTDNKTSLSGCTTKVGKQLTVGETDLAVKADACYINECTRQGLRVFVVYCPPLHCKHFHKPAGACCPFCLKRSTKTLSSKRTSAATTSDTKSTPSLTSTGSTTDSIYTVIDRFHTTESSTTASTSTQHTIIDFWSTSEPSSTPATPTPPYPFCITEDGRQLSVGESVMTVVPGTCFISECTSEGLVQLIGDCLPPFCVDYIQPQGQCCPFCPNGPNCRLPSGEVIWAPVERDGMRCECPPQDYILPGVSSPAHTTAICTLTTVRTTTQTTLPPTTTPLKATTPPGCVTDSGKHLQLGESVTDLLPGACYICECTYQGLSCIHGDCLPPMCVDYVRDDCCYRCPNGQNCRLPSGEIITEPVERDGERCRCPEEELEIGPPSDRYYTALCTPVSTTTSPSTSRATTTMPVGCVTDTGTSLQVGESVTDIQPGSCRICECTYQGLSCIYGDCLPRMCVDYIRDGCCFRCPNGPNCRLPSGEVIWAPVERDGMRCECPPQDYILPGVSSPAHTTANCTLTTVRTTTQTTLPSTTTPLKATTPPGCVTDSGKHLQLGESVTDLLPGACYICECTYQGLSCIHGDCLPPMCVDYVRDDCCYRCPNGQNCRLPSGEIITEPVERDGVRCRCPEEELEIGPPSDRYYTALCTPVSTTTSPSTSRATTTTPVGCVTDTGTSLQVGESVTDIQPGSCRICECTYQGLSCIHGDCLPPMCVDYIRDGCCYRCPNGPNCRLPSGELISAPVKQGGLTCNCPQQSHVLPGVPSPVHTTAFCTP